MADMTCNDEGMRKTLLRAITYQRCRIGVREVCSARTRIFGILFLSYNKIFRQKAATNTIDSHNRLSDRPNKGPGQIGGGSA